PGVSASVSTGWRCCWPASIRSRKSFCSRPCDRRFSDMSNSTAARMAWGAGLTTIDSAGNTLDAWFRWFGWGEYGSDEMVAAHPDLDEQLGLRDTRDELRNVTIRPIRLSIDVDAAP